MSTKTFNSHSGSTVFNSRDSFATHRVEILAVFLLLCGSCVDHGCHFVYGRINTIKYYKYYKIMLIKIIQDSIVIAAIPF